MDIFSGIRVNKDGVPEHEDNFEEAIRNVNSALVPTKVSSFMFLSLNWQKIGENDDR